MARRRNDRLLDVFVALPWWASVIAGSFAFIAMYWIVPSSLANSRIFFGLAPVIRSLAWLVLLVFGITTLVAYARSRLMAGSRKSKGDGGGGLRPMREPKLDMPFTQTTNTQSASSQRQTLSTEGWGASNQSLTEPATTGEVFDTWTIAALRALEWKRFELLCAKYYKAVGFRSETIQCGADGGVDVKLFKIDSNKPLAVVQCKSWNAQSVGVKEVRELLGVMAHQKVRRGIFVTTASYTKDALAFAADNSIQLLDGEGFLKKICDLPRANQDALRKFAFAGDYKTPTCASCGIKMTRRDSKRGAFWGCLNFPRCRSTFVIKE